MLNSVNIFSGKSKMGQLNDHKNTVIWEAETRKSKKVGLISKKKVAKGSLQPHQTSYTTFGIILFPNLAIVIWGILNLSIFYIPDLGLKMSVKRRFVLYDSGVEWYL